MSCSIKIKTIDYLKEQKAITDKKVIADPFKFKELNEELTNLALNKYNVGDGKTKLFKAVQKQTRDARGNYINRYVHEPNEELFELLDEAVAHFNETRDKIAAIAKKKEGYEDNKVEEKYFSDSKTQKISTVLRKIADSSHNLSPLAQKLSELLNKDITIELVEELTSPNVENPSAMYDSEGPRILLKKQPFYLGKGVETTILHEVLHHFTQTQLADFSKPEVKFLDELRTHALKYMKLEDWYALTNLDELAVGLFTDAKFIEAMKEVPPMQTDKKFRNVLEEMLDYILNLLNLSKGDSAYEQAVSVVSNLVETESIRQLEEESSLKSFQKGLPPLFSKGNFGFKSVVQEEMDSVLTSKEEEESEGYDFENTPAKLKTAEQREAELLAFEEGKIDKFVHLGDINEKLDYSIIQINKSINITLAKYEQLQNIYKSKDTDKADQMAEHAMNLRQLQEEINSYQDVERIRAVVTFVEKMHGNMAYVENKLNSVDPSNEKEYFYAIKNYDAYLNAYGVIDVLESNIAYIRKNKDQKIVTEKDLNKIEKKVIEAKAKHGYLKKRITEMMITNTHHYLNDIKFFPRVETKHRERLRKEHKTNKIAEDFKSWYPKMLQEGGRDRDLLNKDLEKAINSLLEDASFDVAAANTWVNSAINTSSTIVQIYQQLFIQLKNRRIEIEMEKDREFKELFEEVTKSFGTNSITKIYKNILEYDKEGKAYLKGEYKVELLTIQTKLKELTTARSAALADKGINSDEFKDLDAQINLITKENFLKKDGVLTPKAKWKNDLSKLSPVEVKMRDFFIDITEGARSDTFGKRSLKRNFNGASFYELPKVTKSQGERLWTGKGKGAISDVWKDLTSVRADDIGFTEVNTDGQGNPLREIPVHYRGKLDPDQQSLDLFSIYRLEFKNGVSHKLRTEVELQMNMLVEIAKNKEYYRTQGTRRRVDRKTGKLDVKKGHESETYKMMQNMMEQQLYDMLHKTGHKISKVDLNKAVGFINGITSFLGMSFNIASGTANVVNANAQLFLEGFIKGHFITAEGIKKANQIYGKHLKTTLTDNTKPIKDSIVSQINEYFDVKGLSILSEANFMQSDLLKAGLSSQALQVFQNSGEHWIQSVITMAVLQGVKVMDKNNNFINAKGEVVKTEKEAASLLDMMEKDEKGVVKMSDKVVYTTHSPLSEWKNGGKEKVDMLIKKKLFDSIGNYTKDMQPEIQRHWWGKLAFMYRKYLIPMGVARFRGMEYADINREDLDEGQDRFSYALQENEEGTYTTLVRYMISAIKEQQYNILSKKNWDQLSDYQKHNLKRAVTELTISFGIIPMVLMAMQAMADDDDDLLFFVMYQLRRLDTELSQYISPGEMFKIMRSPIPSARTVETLLSTVTQVFGFSIQEGEFGHSLLDTYESGRFKGDNKALIRAGKQIPIVKDFLRSYKDLFEFQNSNFGTGM